MDRPYNRDLDTDNVPDNEQDFHEPPGHHPVDDGFCSCGVFCDTGTRFHNHIAKVWAEKLKAGE